MMKGLVIWSLLALAQVDGSSMAMVADGQSEALVADGQSEALATDGASEVAEKAEAVAEVPADQEKKRDYSKIIGKSGKVDLLFVADLNGQIADLRCGEKEGSNFANLLGAINAERGKGLVIGAGNLLGNSPMTRFIEKRGAAGVKELAALFGKAKFDYVLPGAEDFYLSADDFKAYSSAWKENGLPLAISNLAVADAATFGKDLQLEDGYVVLENNGLKIAIIGLNDDRFITGANRDNVQGLSLKGYADVAKEAAKKAKDNGIDFVIAVVNIDDESTAPAHTVALANSVEDVDLVLAAGYGSSKKSFAYRIEMNQGAAPVFASTSNGEGFNKLAIELKGTAEGWQIVRADSNIIAVKEAKADTEVAKVFAGYVQNYCDEALKPIGVGVIDGEMSAEAFGDLLAQSVRHATKSDVMIADSNLVNKDIFPIKGQITDDVMFAGVASDGPVYTFKMTGGDIKGLCGQAGVTLYGVDCANGKINGRDINGSDKYHVAATQSLAGGHLGYLAAFADKMKEYKVKDGDASLSGLTREHLNDPMYQGKANQVVAIDPAKNFPDLSRKVRWAFDGTAQLSVNNTSLSENAAGYTVAQMTRDEQTSIHSLLQLRADANTSHHMFTASGTMKYSMTSTKDAEGLRSDYVESEDLTTLDLIYRYAGFKAMIPQWYMPLPYVEGVLETELTKPEDDVRAYHHLQLTATLGARWNPWAPLEFKVGLGWQKELLDATDDVTFGIETGYTINRFDIAKMGPFTLQGESAMQIFISNFQENPTVKGTWTNKLILNIIGPLGISVADDFFFYREKNATVADGKNKTSFANDVVFSLTFTGRLTTQAF